MVHVLVVVVYLDYCILLYFTLPSIIYIYHLYHFTFLSSFLIPSSHSRCHTPSTSTNTPHPFVYVMKALPIPPTLHYGHLSSLNSCLTNTDLSYLCSDLSGFGMTSNLCVPTGNSTIKEKVAHTHSLRMQPGS